MRQESEGVTSNEVSNYKIQPEMASSYDGVNIVFNMQILPSGTSSSLMTDAVTVLVCISQSLSSHFLPCCDVTNQPYCV